MTIYEEFYERVRDIRKRMIIPFVSIVVSALLMYWFNNKAREKNSAEGTLAHSIEKAGFPDQMEEEDHAHLQNSKMLSEGSQYGVQYFDEIAEEKRILTE